MTPVDRAEGMESCLPANSLVESLHDLANRVEDCAIILRSEEGITTKAWGSLDNDRVSNLLHESAWWIEHAQKRIEELESVKELCSRQPR